MFAGRVLAGLWLAGLAGRVLARLWLARLRLAGRVLAGRVLAGVRLAGRDLLGTWPASPVLAGLLTGVLAAYGRGDLLARLMLAGLPGRVAGRGRRALVSRLLGEVQPGQARQVPRRLLGARCLWCRLAVQGCLFSSFADRTPLFHHLGDARRCTLGSARCRRLISGHSMPAGAAGLGKPAGPRPDTGHLTYIQ